MQILFLQWNIINWWKKSSLKVNFLFALITEKVEHLKNTKKKCEWIVMNSFSVLLSIWQVYKRLYKLCGETNHVQTLFMHLQSEHFDGKEREVLWIYSFHIYNNNLADSHQMMIILKFLLAQIGIEKCWIFNNNNNNYNKFWDQCGRHFWRASNYNWWWTTYEYCGLVHRSFLFFSFLCFFSLERDHWYRYIKMNSWMFNSSFNVFEQLT